MTGRWPGRPWPSRTTPRVAGVPMMNGSKTIEGYVPRRDATIVARMLAAGATITGKAVCEDLCFSGGSHTSRTGPVRNPWDETPLDRRLVLGQRRAGRGGIVDIATGGDQGGSIRMPASWSGHRRAQADLRAGALHRRVPDRADDRPRRADDPHGRRRGAGAERHRRPGRARPAPAPRPRPRRLRGRARPRRRGPAGRCRHRGLRPPELRGRRGRRGARRRRDVCAAPGSPSRTCRSPGTCTAPGSGT